MLYSSAASCFSSLIHRKALFQASVCQVWWKSCILYWPDQSCSLPGLVSNFQNDWLLSLVISLFLSVLWQSVEHTKCKSPHGGNKCCITSVNGLFGVWFPSRLDKLPRWTLLQFCNLWTDGFPAKIDFVSTSFRFLKYSFGIQKDMDFCPVMFLS